MAEATRILLVEDDRNIVDLIRSNLSVRGYDVVVSTDGNKALWHVEVERPDLVILDLMLPGADGFDLCREIRERSPVGIIVVSARRAEHDKVQALNLGADDYITKPFGVEELLARVQRRSRPSAARPSSRLATSSSISRPSSSPAAGQPSISPRPSSTCCGSWP